MTVKAATSKTEIKQTSN